jgi:hypothetical protein
MINTKDSYSGWDILDETWEKLIEKNDSGM